MKQAVTYWLHMRHQFLLHQDISLGVTVGEKFNVTGDYMEIWCLAFAPTSVSCKKLDLVPASIYDLSMMLESYALLF